MDVLRCQEMVPQPLQLVTERLPVGQHGRPGPLGVGGEEEGFYGLPAESVKSVHRQPHIPCNLNGQNLDYLHELPGKILRRTGK